MKLERDAVVAYLEGRGEDVKAHEATDRLPESFDTDEERFGGVLRNLGVDPAQVLNPSEASQTPMPGRSSPTSS